MHFKNLKFFMSLSDSCRFRAGPVAVALLVAAATNAASADSIAAGKSLAMERSKGNCLACYRIEDGELPGTIGRRCWR